MIYLSLGLLFWAGIIAWAACLEAGGDSDAVRKTIAATTFGAIMAGVSLAVALMVPVSPEGWAWVPRAAITVVLTLLVVGMGTRVAMLSRLTAALYGYAAVYAAYFIVVAELSGLDRLTSPHLYNPVIAVVISMVGGAVCAPVSNKLAAALSKG